MADSYIVLEFQLNVNTGAAQKLEGAVFYLFIYFSYMLYFIFSYMLYFFSYM